MVYKKILAKKHGLWTIEASALEGLNYFKEIRMLCLKGHQNREV